MNLRKQKFKAITNCTFGWFKSSYNINDFVELYKMIQKNELTLIEFKPDMCRVKLVYQSGYSGSTPSMNVCYHHAENINFLNFIKSWRDSEWNWEPQNAI
jgi:hypothetical protein